MDPETDSLGFVSRVPKDRLVVTKYFAEVLRKNTTTDSGGPNKAKETNKGQVADWRLLPFKAATTQLIENEASGKVFRFIKGWPTVSTGEPGRIYSTALSTELL